MSEPFPPSGEPESPVTVTYATQLLDERDLDVRAIIQHVTSKEDVSIEEITVVLADHEVVLDLNRRYLDHDYETDVLAFPYSHPSEPISGDIYVDVETAQERHQEFDAALTEEVARYLIHGLLHLCGYSDKKETERSQMKAKEDRHLQETLEAWA